MLKKAKIGFVFLLGLVVLVACGQVGTQKKCITLGTEVSILKKETVKVTGATKEDGKIVVEIETNFSEITLDDFEILLSGYEVDALNYNKTETVACNKSDVFSEGYTGSVTIVFTDDSITKEHELSKYTILVIYDDGNTRIGSDDYLLVD